MNKVLITGASGFIGKNIVELLIEKKIKIIAFLSKDDDLGFNALMKMGVHEFLYENDLFRTDIYFDSCIHLASYGVEYGKDDYDIMLDVNIKLATKIMLFCYRNNCKNFINTGSCFEYGKNNSFQIEENALKNPDTIYAATKTAADIILRNVAKNHKIKYISVRPFGVFGNYEQYYRLLPLVVKHGMNNKPLMLTRGEQIRDYLYVKDVAQAFFKILSTIEQIPSNEDFNICSSNPITVREFIEEIINVFGFDISLYNFGGIQYRKNESMRFVGSNSKLKKMTNWEPQYNLIQAINEYKKFLVDNKF